MKHFEEKEYFYKPAKAGNILSNNLIEYENNGDRNKTLLNEEYLNKSRPYLKDVLNDPKKSDASNFQVMIAIKSMTSKDNEEERVMHSKMII